MYKIVDGQFDDAEDSSNSSEEEGEIFELNREGRSYRDGSLGHNRKRPKLCSSSNGDMHSSIFADADHEEGLDSFHSASKSITKGPFERNDDFIGLTNLSSMNKKGPLSNENQSSLGSQQMLEMEEDLALSLQTNESCATTVHSNDTTAPSNKTPNEVHTQANQKDAFVANQKDAFVQVDDVDDTCATIAQEAASIDEGQMVEGGSDLLENYSTKSTSSKEGKKKRQTSAHVDKMALSSTTSQKKPVDIIQQTEKFLSTPLVSPHETEAMTQLIQNIVSKLWDLFQNEGIDALHEYVKSHQKPKQKIKPKQTSSEESQSQTSANDDIETTTKSSAPQNECNDSDSDIQNDSDKYDLDIQDDISDKQIEMNPRQYQMEMFRFVCQQNTIITLGTGQGKTLIAILTMKHYLETFPNQQVWFLVPSVALAQQQSHVFQANLPYNVSLVYHAAEHSVAARKEWSKCPILVATHGSALELLRHYGDVFSLKNISLLVMDECHYATKQHSYAVLLRHFYHSIPKNSPRPRILGLTASPLINISPADAQSSDLLEAKLQQLEQLMGNAKLLTWSTLGLWDNAVDAGLLESHRQEYIVDFSESFQYNTIPFEIQIPAAELHKARVKECQQLMYLYSELGPTVMGNYCKALINEISRNHFEQETVEEFEKLKMYFKRVQLYCQYQYQGGKTDLMEKLESLLYHLYHCEDAEKEENDTVGIVFVERRITALALKYYFHTHQDSILNQDKTIRCDILTRKTTHIFKYLNMKHNQKGKREKASQKNSERDWLHKIEDTKTVLDRLRKRDINMLLCTSIVEEGVDIDACSFVIVLNDLKSSKSYIQCKGRARQLKAKFFVFENVSKKPSVSLTDARNIEHIVNKHLSRRDTVDKLIIPDNDFGKKVECSECNDDIERSVLENKKYVLEHGMVDIASAKSLINRYAMSIPMESYYRSSRKALQTYLPIYQDSCLYLPAHLPSDVRLIYLPKSMEILSKKEKQSFLALIACVRLHRLNILNDRLLPLKRDDIQKRLLSFALTPLIDKTANMTEQLHISSSSTGLSGNEHNGGKVFIYPIHQNGTVFDQHMSCVMGRDSLALLTMEPLKNPTLQTSFQHKELDIVHLRFGTMREVFLTQNQITKCCEFYSILMNVRWRRRTGSKQFRYIPDSFQGANSKKRLIPEYILACLTEACEIDWKCIEKTITDYSRSEEGRRKAVEEWDGHTPQLWCPMYDPNNTYIAFHQKKGIDCSSPFPDTEYESYRHYYLTKRSFNVDSKCPLIVVQHAWDLPKSMKDCKSSNSSKVTDHSSFKRKNHYQASDVSVMDDTETPEFNMETVCENLGSVLLPLNGCMETPLSDPAILLSSVFLPQFLYELERMEQTYSFLTHCDNKMQMIGTLLRKIPVDEVKEALTAKSCSLKRSYDRLEYLGDAVLKMVHTDALVKTNDRNLFKWIQCLHEGDLSTLRSAMGCNERLCNAAEAAGIDKFVLTKPLGRGMWIPSCLEAFSVNKDSGIEDQEKLKSKETSSNVCLDFIPSLKVKADVIEALIGLVYLHLGYDSASTIIDQLCLSVTKDNHFSDNLPDDIVVNNQLISDACSFLGVKEFKNAPLLLEATSHPSKFHSKVPSYQRLEWIGDAVLCLAAREWVFKTNPNFPVKLLVQIETTLICNETLAFFGYSSGLHRHISHCDYSLPSRLDKYELNIRDSNKGLWGTDPPKSLADIVEALLGATHIDHGFKQGQLSALHVVKPAVVFLKNITDNGEKIIGTSRELKTMIHPKQQLFELCQSLKVKCYSSHDYSRKQNNTLWYGDSFGEHVESKCDFVGEITWLGVSFCVVAEKASSIMAKNRACALLSSVLDDAIDLRQKLFHMSEKLSPLLK